MKLVYLQSPISPWKVQEVIALLLPHLYKVGITASLRAYVSMLRCHYVYVVDFVTLSIAIVYETLQDCDKIMVSLSFVSKQLTIIDLSILISYSRKFLWYVYFAVCIFRGQVIDQDLRG